MILFFKVVGLTLRFGFEDGCHEHMPLVKSGELRLPVNSAKKNTDEGAYPTSDTIKPHSFRLTLRRRRMVSCSMLLISRASEILILFVFLHD